MAVPTLLVQYDAEAATVHETALEDVLDFEVHIDLARLRELASAHLPAALRPKVYPLLLGVAPVDKTAEMTTMRQQEDAFAAITRRPGESANDPHSRGRRLKKLLGSALGGRLPARLRAQLQALATPAAAASFQGASGAAASKQAAVGSNVADAAALRERQLVAVEGTLAAHVPSLDYGLCYATGASTHLPHVEPVAQPVGLIRTDGLDTRLAASSPLGALREARSASDVADGVFAWHLHATLLCAHATESAHDAFFCAEALHSTLTTPGGLWTHTGQRDTYGLFLMVLHHSVEDVYNQLHDLGESSLQWAPALLAGLFVDRMPTDRLLEVWDYYIASGDIAMHVFVCVALLEHWMEQLLDLEAEELRQLITGPWRPDMLPPTPVLLRSATKLREELRARKVL